MKISTGTLVFNAESTMPKGMLEAQLKQLYSFSDEILISEGATKAGWNHYWDGDTSWATKTGRSTDNTIEIIKSFPDPDNKIKILQNDDFWPGKTYMCNAWAEEATGDYFWQVDADEFYLKEDVEKVKLILEKYKPDAVHFFANHFWGDFNHCIDENTGRNWGNDIPWMRIFRHEPGSRWMAHEPPTYQWPDGSCSDTSTSIISREQTLDLGIKMFHYSCVCEEQIEFKTKFFRNSVYKKFWKSWKKDHDSKLLEGSTTVKFEGQHPEFVRSILK